MLHLNFSEEFTTASTNGPINLYSFGSGSFRYLCGVSNQPLLIDVLDGPRAKGSFTPLRAQTLMAYGLPGINLTQAMMIQAFYSSPFLIYKNLNINTKMPDTSGQLPLVGTPVSTRVTVGKGLLMFGPTVIAAVTCANKPKEELQLSDLHYHINEKALRQRPSVEREIMRIVRSSSSYRVSLYETESGIPQEVYTTRFQYGNRIGMTPRAQKRLIISAYATAIEQVRTKPEFLPI